MSVALSNTYLIKRKTNSPGAKGDVYQLHEIIYIICQRVYFFLKNPVWTQVLLKGKQFLHHLVTNIGGLINSYEWEKDRIRITINGTYPWSFVTQIFRNG